MITKKRIIISVSALVFCLISLTIAGCLMSKVENPEYKVLSKNGDIETRSYKPMIIAEVNIIGERRESISQGFRLIADYIFGNNTVKKEIAMTAPVQQQKSVKIAMTAPVEQQLKDGIWQVSFIMPSEYSMETLPKPNNPKVSLKEIPARKFIVIEFSGNSTDENIKSHEKTLLDYIKKHNIKIIGSPKYAFYNPPWTPSFMRRNEVMLQLK